jgi:hypothetical protein
LKGKPTGIPPAKAGGIPVGKTDEIKKTYGKRVTKTAVIVAAFAAYLWEFKHKGQESLLYKHLIEAENA